MECGDGGCASGEQQAGNCAGMRREGGAGLSYGGARGPLQPAASPGHSRAPRNSSPLEARNARSISIPIAGLPIVYELHTGFPVPTSIKYNNMLCDEALL